MRLRGSDLAFQQAFGRWGVSKIWRDDLLPCPVYLRHVVLAAAGMDWTFFHNNSSKEAAAGSAEAAAASSSSTTIAAAAGEVECETWSISALLNDAAAAAGAAATVASPSSSTTSALTLSFACGVMLSSFLDGTFFGERSTSVRSFLRSKAARHAPATAAAAAAAALTAAGVHRKASQAR